MFNTGNSPIAIRALKAFQTKERAEQFLDGMLYMNTLAFFRWHGTDDQRDPLEGASGFVLPESIHALPRELLEVQAHKAAILPAGLSYANICSFFMQEAIPAGVGTRMESPGDPSKLGPFYVAIDNFQKFIDRIDVACKVRNLHYYCAPVSYWEIEPVNEHQKGDHSILVMNDVPLDAGLMFPGGVPEFPHDVFYKNKRYGHQMEWRIALNRDISCKVAYRLRIGSLRDIAHLVTPDKFDADTDACASLPHAWIVNPEGGNITRKAFFDELYAIESDRFYAGMIIG